MVTEPDSLKRWITDSSALYHLYQTVRGMITAESYNLTHGKEDNAEIRWTEMPKTPAANKEEMEKLDRYEARIRILSEKIRAFGSQPIFVTQPLALATVRGGKVLLRKEKSPDGYFTLNRFNQRLMQTCHELRAVCVDLANELSFDPGDFYDRIHTTPNGSLKIGEYLYGVLKNLSKI